MLVLVGGQVEEEFLELLQLVPVTGRLRVEELNSSEDKPGREGLGNKLLDRVSLPFVVFLIYLNLFVIIDLIPLNLEHSKKQFDHERYDCLLGLPVLALNEYLVNVVSLIDQAVLHEHLYLPIGALVKYFDELLHHL